MTNKCIFLSKIGGEVAKKEYKHQYICLNTSLEYRIKRI